MGLKAVNGRVVVRIELQQKNYHTFENGQTIRLERDRENFDRTYTQQVLGTVIDAENIPSGALVLCNHNCTHDSYKVFNTGQLSGEEIAAETFIFAIPETEVYLWKTNGEWMPTKGFAIGLRIFERYKGIIQGIEPKKIKNTLYITSGELAGKVVRTLKACDYIIIFRNEKGVEERILRCRHYEDEYNEREEIVAIDHGATKKVLKGDYLVGLEPSDCKPLNQYLNDRRRTTQNDTIVTA
jgi:hypothetical protein